MIPNHQVIHTDIQNVITFKPHDRAGLMEQILYEQPMNHAYLLLWGFSYLSVQLCGFTT